MNLIPFIVKIVIALPVAIWLYRDSRARDFSWMVWTFLPVIIILSPFSLALILLITLLAIYFISRPQGNLFNCPHCQKKVHEILFVCPFCRKNAKHECLNCHEPVPWDAEQCPYCKSRNLTKE